MTFSLNIGYFARAIAIILAVAIWLAVIAGVGMFAHIELMAATKSALAAVGASSLAKPIIALELLVTLAIAVWAFMKGTPAIVDSMLSEPDSSQTKAKATK